MRIIGYIEHPVFKITVFKMDEKFSVKLESGLYEQTYKFRAVDQLSNLDDIRKIVDAEFIRSAEEILGTMHQNKLRALKRQFKPGPEESFEEII